MTFGSVNGAYLTLKQRLAVHVGGDAIGEITVQPPPNSNDELSFLRLVSWAYTLIHEAGRVALNFLKELPPSSSYEPILPHVRGLRTWISHNLSLAKDSDRKAIAAAFGWFRRTCGVGTPASPEQWQACFSGLCTELTILLNAAIRACDSLDSRDDGARLTQELNKRLQRNWDAYRFDSYVETAKRRLGYGGLNTVVFRQRHLDNWRKIVAIAEDGAIDRLLALRIEADLLLLMGDALPVTTSEILEKARFTDPAQLGAAMMLMRRLSSPGLSLSETLGAVLSEYLASQVQQAQNGG